MSDPARVFLDGAEDEVRAQLGDDRHRGRCPRCGWTYDVDDDQRKCAAGCGSRDTRD